LVIGFIDHSQVVTTTKYNIPDDSDTTNHSTLNLLSVLSLVFNIRFLATDVSHSHPKFKYHCNYSTCKFFNSHTEFLLAQPNSFDCRVPDFRSTTLSLFLSSDSIPDNSLHVFDTFHLLTGHSTGTILTSK
jgi:hypothetical protein